MHSDDGHAVDRAWRIDGFWSRAEQAYAAGRLEDARVGYEALLTLAAGHPGALLRLSTLATAQGRYRDAVEILLRLAATPPDDVDLLLALVGMLHRLGEAAAARRCLAHPALAATGTTAAQRLDAARLALDLEDIATARRLLAAAEAQGGATAASRYLAGTLATFEGRQEVAGQAFEDCLALAPLHAQAHWALSRARRQSPGANHVDRLRRALAASPAPRQRCFLQFALFKELDDLGDVDDAWRALMQGCADKRALLAASRATATAAVDEAAMFEALTAAWSPGAAARATDRADAPDATQGPRPIFIVGLPRTGTTLLERILAGSDAVAEAGELEDIPLQLRWLADRFARSHYDADVVRAARVRADPALLGRRYLAHAAWRAGGRPWFTDKLPLNFLNLGFIVQALPGAPILHMVRNPMDSCFSNLKELFNEAYPYSYSLDDIATHYGRYRRLMAHWHACFPGRILDVPYEGLVAEPEAWARRVLAHCGLPWTEAALALAERGGAVTTASAVQVREPIHARGVGAWRRYAGPLAPLRERLQRDGWLGDDAGAGDAGA